MSQFKNNILWGFLLWLFGYIIGFIYFMFVPVSHIGWWIMPDMIFFTIVVTYYFIKQSRLDAYFRVGLLWLVMAVTLDYFLLVQLLHPADGYYKLDVYIYYILIVLIPVITGWIKLSKTKSTS